MQQAKNSALDGAPQVGPGFDGLLQAAVGSAESPEGIVGAMTRVPGDMADCVARRLRSIEEVKRFGGGGPAELA